MLIEAIYSPCCQIVNWISCLNCVSCKVFCPQADNTSQYGFLCNDGLRIIRSEHLISLKEHTILSLYRISIQTSVSRCQDEVPSMLLFCSLVLWEADRRNLFITENNLIFFVMFVHARYWIFLFIYCFFILLLFTDNPFKWKCMLLFYYLYNF